MSQPIVIILINRIITHINSNKHNITTVKVVTAIMEITSCSIKRLIDQNFLVIIVTTTSSSVMAFDLSAVPPSNGILS